MDQYTIIYLGSFERRTNENLQQLYNKPSLRQFLVRMKLEQAGHVWRAEGSLIKKSHEKQANGEKTKRQILPEMA